LRWSWVESDKGAASVACRSTIDGIVDRPAGERTRTQYGEALPAISGLEGAEALEDRDRLALAHLHDGLLPRPCATARRAAALGLGLDAERPHLDHVHAEERLDGLADLRLVRVGVDAERV